MAKTPTKTDAEGADKSAQAADDTMPEIDDDVEVSARQQPETEDADEVPRRKPQRQDEETADDDPRARAVRRYREQRDRDEAAARAAKEAEQQPPEDIEPVDDSDQGDEDPADGDNDQQTEREAEKPARKFKLKINGKEEEVTEEELISLAQIAKASDNLLDVAKTRASEATRLLKEAQEAQQRLREGSEHPPARKAAPQPDPSREQSDPEHPPVAGLDREKLRQYAERIQVGDADEGAQALIDLAEEITAKVTPKVDPSEIERVVHRTTAQTRTQAELDAALESFASKYPDIAKDELLAEAGKTVLRKEIIKDLESAGVDEATISSFARDERLLVQAHKDLRAANKGVRSYADLLETTGKTLSDRFNIKAASPQPATKTAAQQRVPVDPDRIQDRIDRKRAAPQQTRAVGVRQQVAPPPQPRTTRDIVRAMRKGRGFTLSD